MLSNVLEDHMYIYISNVRLGINIADIKIIMEIYFKVFNI